MGLGVVYWDNGRQRQGERRVLECRGKELEGLVETGRGSGDIGYGMR